MITAYGDADTRRKALEGGAEALLTKPIDFVALGTEIDSRVAGARADVRSGSDCVKTQMLGFAGAADWLTKARLSSDRLHQTTYAQNADYPFHVVGQDV